MMDAFNRRRRLFAPLAVLLAAACVAGANAAPPPGVPGLPLAPPPVANNQAASSIFDAMMAISRATVTNPAAAQAATFPYAAAIQRYNAGDLTTAQQNALQAISTTAQTPFIMPSTQPTPIMIPTTTPLPLPRLVDPSQADAEEFLALARRSLMNCGAPPAQLANLQNLYQTAVGENVQHQWQNVRTEAKAIIDGCAVPAPVAPAPAAT
jgi:hypothetical protein